MIIPNYKQVFAEALAKANAEGQILGDEELGDEELREELRDKHRIVASDVVTQRAILIRHGILEAVTSNGPRLLYQSVSTGFGSWPPPRQIRL